LDDGGRAGALNGVRGFLLPGYSRHGPGRSGGKGYDRSRFHGDGFNVLAAAQLGKHGPVPMSVRDALRTSLREKYVGSSTVRRDQGLSRQEPSNLFAVGFAAGDHRKETAMHGLIYLIGLIVVIMAILSFFGLR
jgi:hypothetical protein